MKLREEFAKLLNPFFDSLSVDEITKMIEIPPNSELGDLAFPCFTLAKLLKKSPAVIASETSEKISASDFFDSFKNVGPYINAFVNAKILAENVVPEIIIQKNGFGNSDHGKNKTVVVDFSSPNIAKPLGIHHIRTTMIGNSLCHLYQKLGYQVVRLNYLGDWGTQFGKLMVAFQKWGGDMPEQMGIIQLTELYVRFSKAAKEDDSLNEEARNWFKKLEDGDKDAVKLWETFKNISIEEFKKLYERLNVTFDVYSGESYHTKRIEDVIKICQEKQLAELSEGALVVNSDADNAPPCLLKKSDGATTYESRDIAAVLDRFDQFHFEKMIYVVAQDQSLHFNLVFEVLKKMGFSKWDQCVHVPFGLIRFKDGKFSTREGNIILLNDVLDTAVEKVKEIISQRENASDIDDTSIEIIAKGAVVFADLSSKRIKNVEFVWEDVLNFDGDTGPYLQYSAARCNSIVRKSQVDISGEEEYGLLTSSFEKAVILKMNEFNRMVQMAAEQYEPSLIANYLLDLSRLVNRMIHSGKEDASLRVIQSTNLTLQKARTGLVKSIAIVIEEGLRLLGIFVPKAM